MSNSSLKLSLCEFEFAPSISASLKSNTRADEVWSHERRDALETGRNLICEMDTKHEAESHKNDV